MQTWKRSAAIALVAALAACSGGTLDGTTQGANGGQAAVPGASVYGTVTGLGSTAIDGVSYDDSAVQVQRELDPAAAVAAALADLRVGCQVEGTVDAQGKLITLTVRPTLVGPVTAVDAAGNTFTMLGQTVHVGSATLFEGATGVAGLAVGDWVVVFATVDASDGLVATRVERVQAPGTVKIRVGGIVSGLDAAAKTFKLGDLTVDFGAATIAPEGATLADGLLAFVYAEALPVGGKLVAKSVRVTQLPQIEGREVVLGGRISAFTGLGSFRVSGIPVDASAAQVEGGAAADLANGVRVRVEGTLHVTGSAPLRVVVKASKVKIFTEAEGWHVILFGPVSEFTSVSSFKVLGSTVDAHAAQFDGGTASDLAVGKLVLVLGHAAGGVVTADNVRFVSSSFPMPVPPIFTPPGTQITMPSMPPTSGTTTPVLPVVVSGTISSVTAAGITVGSQAVQLASTTVLDPPGHVLATGDRVVVAAHQVGTGLVADRVAVLPGILH